MSVYYLEETGTLGTRADNQRLIPASLFYIANQLFEVGLAHLVGIVRMCNELVQTNWSNAILHGIPRLEFDIGQRIEPDVIDGGEGDSTEYVPCPVQSRRHIEAVTVAF